MGQPESKQNLPFTLETAKAKPPQKVGIPAIRRVAFSYTEIHNGGIVPSSSTDAKRSKLFRRKWAIARLSFAEGTLEFYP